MTAAEFVSRLEKVKKNGGGYMARCPAHDDRKASLSVKEGDDGRVLVKCHTGCETEAIVAALGLEMKDLFPEAREQRPARRSGATGRRGESPSASPGDGGRTPQDAELGRQVAAANGEAEGGNAGRSQAPLSGFSERVAHAYDYVDENGGLLFQSVRLRDPKDFRQRQNLPGFGPVKDAGGKTWKADKDGWVWSLGNDVVPHARRVPYRLSEVLVAAGDGRAVWVVEGEKDADALAEEGFAATSNPMGAGSWEDEYAAHLRGCAWALVVSDCDEAGRRHAHAVAKSLRDAKVKVKVLELAADRDDGYDVSDCLAEYGVGRLREIAKTTPPWAPEDAERALSPRPPILGVGEFVSGIPVYDESKDYLGPFIHGGYRVHVAGPIGHGKTSFLCEAMSAALTGSEFLGWQGKGGDLRGLFIDLEMPGELLAQAVRDARLDQAPGFSLLHLPDGIEVDTSARDQRMLERAVEGFHIVVIDPWYKLLEQEMEYSSARGVVGLLDGIRNRHPEMCMLVGFHAQEPKTPKAPIDLGGISGFKVFQRPADVVLTFQRTEGDKSRIMWVKNRSPRLGVKMREKWALDWRRGEGFTRSDGAAAELLRLLSDEWLTTSELAELWGKSRQFTSRTLAGLDGKVESVGDDSGGRGQSKSWRLKTEEVPFD